MGLMDELRKLTQSYDNDDFYDGAENGLQDQTQASAAQLAFETNFGSEPTGTPEPAAKPKPAKSASEGGLFSGLGKKNAAKPRSQRERTVNFGGSDQQVILFSPKTFDEAGELVNYLGIGRSVVMTLEGVPNDSARRLLDFLSGITFALEGKITPISAKTYFVTPQHVDVLNPGTPAPEQPVSGGQYF